VRLPSGRHAGQHRQSPSSDVELGEAYIERSDGLLHRALMTPWDRRHRQASASINESLIRGTTAASATFRSHAIQQRLPPALREARLSSRGTSAKGQKRRFDSRPVTSGLSRIADNFQTSRHVSKVPISDIIRLPDPREVVRFRAATSGLKFLTEAR
jgi:hypothetical protein